MSAVLIRQSRTVRARRSAAASRVMATLIAAVALAGMIVVAPTQAQPVVAATSDSELTVKWTGDSSSANSFQPDRLPSSPHYREFKDIQISVSQTTGIIDQAVRVSVTGFAGTRSNVEFGTNAQNFLQAMQCWGPDPLAEDFNETCQWGGRYVPGVNPGNSVYKDNLRRVAAIDTNPSSPTSFDVPFRTAGGKVISGKETIVDGQTKYPIGEYFTPSTTNEVASARVGANGSGYFDFETQSADQAPQLGCGTAEHLRCWLVVVPRGTVFGGDGEQCSDIRDPRNGYEPYAAGRVNSIQAGSPVNPKCDYWDNRIVLPLDFAPVGSTCEVGSAEFRVVGSQLMVGAMSSWQPSLCQTMKSTFSFATNPDAIARAQLIEPGATTPGIAYTGFPVSSGELLQEYEREQFAKTTLVYAPVAVSSVVVAFIAEFDSGRQQEMVLSPRLVAKLLTQSYPFTVPSNSSDPSRSFLHLPEKNREYNYFYKDPEFQELNPNYSGFTENPAIVLPGPSGADAIRQVWRWILADKEAVAFLEGTADKWGMSINPYYLPRGHPNAHVTWFLDGNAYAPDGVDRKVGLTNIDGTPQKLSTAVLDSFPKNDESVVPLNMVLEKSRFNSLQYAPYTDNLLSGARQAFRADPNSKTVWDAIKLNAAGEAGDWVSSGIQAPGSKFMIVVTDSVSANRYGLSTAALRVPNTTTAVHADEDGMANALSALRPTSLDTVKQVDPSQTDEKGYPLTIVTYAGVNLTKSTPTSRTTISSMLKQVTVAGQEPGSGIGQLPVGYLPLTADLTAQAATAAGMITSYVEPKTATSKPTNGIGQDEFTAGMVNGDASTGTDPSLTSGMDDLSGSRTQVSSASPIERFGLVIALVLGLAGLLIAPTLFRGRGLR